MQLKTESSSLSWKVPKTQIHQNDSKTTLFGTFQNVFKFLCHFRMITSKHNKTHQNSLKTLRNSEKQLSFMW